MYPRERPKLFASHCSCHFSEVSSPSSPHTGDDPTAPCLASPPNETRGSQQELELSSHRRNLSQSRALITFYKYLFPVTSPLFHGSGRDPSRVEDQGACKGVMRTCRCFYGILLCGFLSWTYPCRRRKEGKEEREFVGIITWPEGSGEEPVAANDKLTIDRTWSRHRMLTGTTLASPLGGIWGADTADLYTGSRQPEPRDRAANRAGYSGRSEHLLLTSRWSCDRQPSETCC
ncbi:hypothetical protein ACQKWADRAFT_122028 [Trichoderma austrokoningii]